MLTYGGDAVADEGHEIRLQHLHAHIYYTEEIAKQLSQQKTALVDAQRVLAMHQRVEQQRLAEETEFFAEHLAEQELVDQRLAETRIAEQKRVKADERRLAEESQHAAEHLAEQRLAAERLDSVEKPIANGSRVAEEKHIVGEEHLVEYRAAEGIHIVAEGSRLAEERQLAAERFAKKRRIGEERRPAQVKRRAERSQPGERLAQESHFMEEGRERGAASSSQLGRALSTNSKSRSLPTVRYCHSNLYTSATAPPAHRTCVAYHTVTHASKYGRIRCATETLHGATPRCQQHQDEYDQTVSELRTAQAQHRNADVIVRDIQSRWRKLRRTRTYSLPQLTQDSVEVTRFLSLGGVVKVLATTVRRLEGYREYCVLVAWATALIISPIQAQAKHPDDTVGMRANCDPLDQSTAEDLLAKLEDTRLKLRRPRPWNAAKNASTPAQNGQAGEDRRVAATQSTAPPVPPKDTSGDRAGAAGVSLSSF